MPAVQLDGRIDALRRRRNLLEERWRLNQNMNTKICETRSRELKRQLMQTKKLRAAAQERNASTMKTMSKAIERVRGSSSTQKIATCLRMAKAAFLSRVKTCYDEWHVAYEEKARHTIRALDADLVAIEEQRAQSRDLFEREVRLIAELKAKRLSLHEAKTRAQKEAVDRELYLRELDAQVKAEQAEVKVEMEAIRLSERDHSTSSVPSETAEEKSNVASSVPPASSIHEESYSPEVPSSPAKISFADFVASAQQLGDSTATIRVQSSGSVSPLEELFLQKALLATTSQVTDTLNILTSLAEDVDVKEVELEAVERWLDAVQGEVLSCMEKGGISSRNDVLICLRKPLESFDHAHLRGVEALLRDVLKGQHPASANMEEIVHILVAMVGFCSVEMLPTSFVKFILLKRRGASVTSSDVQYYMSPAALTVWLSLLAVLATVFRRAPSLEDSIASVVSLALMAKASDVPTVQDVAICADELKTVLSRLVELESRSFANSYDLTASNRKSITARSPDTISSSSHKPREPDRSIQETTLSHDIADDMHELDDEVYELSSDESARHDKDFEAEAHHSPSHTFPMLKADDDDVLPLSQQEKPRVGRTLSAGSGPSLFGTDSAINLTQGETRTSPQKSVHVSPKPAVEEEPEPPAPEPSRGIPRPVPLAFAMETAGFDVGPRTDHVQSIVDEETPVQRKRGMSAVTTRILSAGTAAVNDEFTESEQTASPVGPDDQDDDDDQGGISSDEFPDF